LGSSHCKPANHSPGTSTHKDLHGHCSPPISRDIDQPQTYVAYLQEIMIMIMGRSNLVDGPHVLHALHILQVPHVLHTLHIICSIFCMHCILWKCCMDCMCCIHCISCTWLLLPLLLLWRGTLIPTSTTTMK
jgi:hypothetical protein